MGELHERYRPQKWSGVVGQDAAISAIQEALKDGWGGRAWWIVGETGTGCTTIAWLLAKEQADEKRVRRATGDEVECPMVERMGEANPGGERTVVPRAYIIDGPLITYMPEDAMHLLSKTLACLPKNVCVIFAMNPEDEYAFTGRGEPAQQIVRACHRVKLETKGLEEPFAQRAKEIAEKEGLGGKDISIYRKLARDCHCSMWGMLSQIETWEPSE